MKTKLLAATLLGGLLSTGFAMASTSAPDYTLLTSSNLVGNYNVVDSGYVRTSGRDQIGSSVAILSTTTSTAFGSAYQDASGQWYQPTEIATTDNYETSYQNFTQDTRYISVQTTANLTNSFLDLTVTTSSPLTYNAYAYGVYASTYTPQGIRQAINSSMGLVIDGQQVSNNTPEYTGYFQYWYAGKDGVTSNSFQVVAESRSGGYFTNLDLLLTADKVLGAITSEIGSSEGPWYSIQNVPIAAPVPEPETYAMMLAGLGMMGAVARRRKQNKA